MSHPATELPIPPPIAPEKTLTAAQWGMASFLLSEVAFFGTLIVTYIAFMGRDVVGPTPAEALSLPLVLAMTCCLLASSVLVHGAEDALARGRQRKFCLLLGGAIVLGVLFLIGTAVEWRGLIDEHHLTIGRNLFGTTYYTLVGFHGVHVTVGLIAMLILLGLAIGREVDARHRTGVELVAWYWHFVDAVWIVVFLVVYIASRGGI